MINYCPECGKKIIKDAVFCEGCGQKILNKTELEQSIRNELEKTLRYEIIQKNSDKTANADNERLTKLEGQILDYQILSTILGILFFLMVLLTFLTK